MNGLFSGLIPQAQPMLPRSPLEQLLLANSQSGALTAQQTPVPQIQTPPAGENPFATLAQEMLPAAGTPAPTQLPNTAGSVLASQWADQPATMGDHSQWANVQAPALLPTSPATNTPDQQSAPQSAAQAPASAPAETQQATTQPTTTKPAEGTKTPEEDNSFSAFFKKMFETQTPAASGTTKDGKAPASVWDDKRILQMMSAVGSSVSAGEPAGVALARGFGAYNRQDAEDKNARIAAEEKTYQRAQDSFKNKIETGKLIINGKTADANALLKQAQTEAAKAKIPLTQAEVQATLQGISESKQRMALARNADARAAAKEGRDAEKDKEGKKISPENYAKLLLQTQQNIEKNALDSNLFGGGDKEADGGFNQEQQARMRVNAALPPDQRHYAPITAEELTKYKEQLAAMPEGSDERKTLLARIALIYGE